MGPAFRFRPARRRKTLFGWFLFAAGLRFLSAHSTAATLYWDAGTNQVWGTAGNWSTDLAGTTAASAAPGSADTAVFNSTAHNGTNTVTFVNSNTAVSGMVFNNTGTTTLYTTGSGITLSIGSGGVTVNSGAGATTIAAANSTLLIKLTASQTWTNNSSNTLAGQGTYDYNGGSTATWTFSGSGNTSISATVGNSSGTLGLAQTGTGTTSLFGGSANTYSGGTSITNGTLILSKSDGVNATGTGSVTVGDSTGSANTAVLRLDSNNQIADTSAVTVNSDGQFNVNGFTETIGSLAGSGSTSLGAGALTAGGNNTSTTYSGSMSGTGSFTKNGTGTMTLTGSSTFTGGTTINAGTLQLTTGSSILANNSLITVNTGGTLEISKTNPTNITTNAVDVALNGGTYLMDGGAANTGSWVRNLSFTDGGSMITAAGVGSFQGFNVGLSGNVSMTGTGNASITLQDGMDLITNSTWNIGSTGTLAVTTTLIEDGGSRTLTKTGTGSLTLAGTASNLLSGAFNVNDGTVNLNKTAGMNATGTGALVIGDSTGSANTAVVKLLANNQINNTSAVTVNSDGQFNVNGMTETIGSLAGSGSTSLGAGALTTGGSNASTTYSGVISGTGSLTKAGTGTMTLSNNNTFTGATTVSAGTLALTVANALSASSDVTVAAGAVITTGASNSQEFHSLSGAGTVTLGTGANLTIDAASASFTGTINLDSATLTLSGITLGNGATLNVTGNSVIDFSGNSTLNLASLTLAAGATLEIKNWVAGQDFFIDSGTVNGSAVNTISPGTGALASINFDGFTNSTSPGGTPTGWRSWSSPGNQIAPVPEPSTYGLLALGSALAFLALRRSRKPASVR